MAFKAFLGATLAFFVTLPATALGTELYGPVLGDAEMTSIKIWVQTDIPATVEVEYWARDNGPHQKQTLNTRNKHLSGVFEIEGLTPGQTYDYRVSVDEKPVQRMHPFSFSTLTYWQKRTPPPDFSFALGSCAYMKPEAYGIFESIYRQNPQMMLWMGDNVYLRPTDLYSEQAMARRYQTPRRTKELQALFANVPQYAIWDDHDYGGNDGDRSYRMRENIYNVFKSYWPNPSFGLPGTPGVFTRFEKSDVEFFLTDNRYHRAPNRLKDPARTFFGEAQWQWLKDSLSSSTSTFKLIVLGNETLNTQTPSENMYSYTGAYREFLDWLKTSEIPGIVLLSGDRHHTELLKKERPGSYPLYEWCVSPLTSNAYPPFPVEQDLEIRIPGSLYTKRNFGMVEVTGPVDNRQLILKRYSATGEENWRYVLKARDLQPTPQKNTK